MFTALQSVNHIIQDIAQAEGGVDTFQSIMKNQVTETTKNLQVSKTVEKVDIHKAFMLKFNKTSAEELLTGILNDGDKNELNQWRTVTPVNNFQHIRKQAEREFDIEREINDKTYIDKFVEECPANERVLSI